MSDHVSGAGVLRLARVVPAPRERVFRAWTDPDELKRWWGPGRFTTPHAEVDLRPGGRYVLVMQPPDGSPLRLAGTYREVHPPEAAGLHLALGGRRPRGRRDAGRGGVS